MTATALKKGAKVHTNVVQVVQPKPVKPIGQNSKILKFDE
jgi:hypothetical protein